MDNNETDPVQLVKEKENKLRGKLKKVAIPKGYVMTTNINKWEGYEPDPIGVNFNFNF